MGAPSRHEAYVEDMRDILSGEAGRVRAANYRLYGQSVLGLSRVDLGEMTEEQCREADFALADIAST